jgi:hypothetical protein
MKKGSLVVERDENIPLLGAGCSTEAALAPM